MIQSPWRFHKIDPTVIEIAQSADHFQAVQECKAEKLEIIEGDARVTLQKWRSAELGLLVLDAFSSDSPPLHLLTREAMRMYRRLLGPGGMIALHLSNRYLDLEPVASRVAREVGLQAAVRLDIPISRERKAKGHQPSHWVVLAPNQSVLANLDAGNGWRPARVAPTSELWTDDFSNLLKYWKLGWGR